MEVLTWKSPHWQYLSAEFKEEAVKMVIEEGLSIGGLSIPKSTLDYWVKKAREGKLLDSSYKKHKPVTTEEMELARLRRDNVAQIPHSPYMQGIISIKEWLLHMA